MNEKWNLKRLSEMDDFDVADNDPDPRGWDVVAGDGTELGEVDDLIVDPSSMKVRYLDVELDRDALHLEENRHVLLPVTTLNLDTDDEKVLLSGLQREQIALLPPFDRNRPFDSDYDTRYFHRTAAPAMPPPFPERVAERAEGHERIRGAATEHEVGDQRRITRSEEELRVGKRPYRSGEVAIRKTVETEHVERPVTRSRERVHVERRPASGEIREGTPRIGEDEIRVPVVEEELVTEKRPVVKEEYVVSKDRVQEKDQVKADLRKERVDVEREGNVKERDLTGRRGR